MTTASSLFGDLDVHVEPDAHIGALTWYGVGGRADFLVQPRTLDSLKTLVRRCHRTGTSLRVFGSGANLLVSDEGVDGIVVKLNQPAFREMSVHESAGIHSACVGGGADLARTLMDLTRRGLEGLSHMAGIPATIGGAVRMNAGGAYGSISDTLMDLTCLSKTGDEVTYKRSDLNFEYRSANITDPIILSATLQLSPTDPIELRQRVKDIFSFKKSTQPLADHSAGCTFKNPLNPVSEQRVPAGKLIDETGLKGFSVGGASISDRHANFIVTQPGATAADVIQLLEKVRQRVFEKSGYELETEIVIWERSDSQGS